MRCAVRRTAPAVCIVLLALGAAGCLGRGPEARFYTLAPVPASPSAPELTAHLAVAVGLVVLPDALDRPQIVTREEPNRLRYDEFHRWAGTLGSEVSRVLGENLATRLGSARVLVYPAELPLDLTYRVRVDVQQFDGRPSDDVTLRARWALMDGAARDVLAIEESTVRRDTEGAGFEGLVEAYGAVIGTLCDEITDRIAALERAQQ
jgi:uncharacterized lipoprotein YmbA